MLKKLGLVLTLTAALAGVTAGGGAAANTGNSVFLCYSTYQVSPGAWPQSMAAGLLAKGYWLPWAEKSVPTATQLPNGWYLRCNLTPTVVENVSQVATWVGETGHRIVSPYRLGSVDGAEGYYPMAP